MNKILIFSLLFIASLSFVYAVPMVPTVFAGNVAYGPSPSQNLMGYDINVSIGSSSYSWKVGEVQSGNQFEIMVDPQGVSGDIHFYIGDVETIELGTYVMGAYVEQDLTIGSLPSGSPTLYCGDNSCNNGETCNSCSQDCGVCDDDDDDDDDDNGGGGGGGSSSRGSDNEIIVISNPSTNSGSTGASVSNYDGASTYTPKEDKSDISSFFASKELLTALAIVVVILSIIILITPKR